MTASRERFGDICQRLRLPLVAAPMLLTSGPELVAAACRSGVIGAFPTANAKSSIELNKWLVDISRKLAEHGESAAPVAANLIVHPGNSRLRDDLAVLTEHRVELVITSVGSPTAVLGPLHDAGALVFADVASLHHARRAIEAGVDGLILLAGGAGGQTGWANPFAFVRGVREIFDGPIVLAGGLMDGISLAAARTLGADLGYMGTRFLATKESMAAEPHKQMVQAATLDDIVQSPLFTGIPTNMLAPSIEALGIDTKALKEGHVTASEVYAKLQGGHVWHDLYSAGHSVSGIRDVPSVAELVERLSAEYFAHVDNRKGLLSNDC